MSELFDPLNQRRGSSDAIMLSQEL